MEKMEKETLYFWRRVNFVDQENGLVGPVVADLLRGVELVESRQFSVEEATALGCPDWALRERRWNDHRRFEHASNFDHVCPCYPDQDQRNVGKNRLCPSLDYGASRCSGKDWLTKDTGFQYRTDIERPSWGRRGDGTPLLQLPLNWGYFLISARGLHADVIETDEQVVTQTCWNAFAFLAPFNTGVAVKLRWSCANGKWSHGHEWAGTIAVIGEGFVAKTAPASEMRQL